VLAPSEMYACKLTTFIGIRSLIQMFYRKVYKVKRGFIEKTVCLVTCKFSF